MEKFDDEWYSSILSELNLTGDVRGEDVEFPVSPLSRHVAPLKLVLELQERLSASVKIHQFVFIKSSTNIPSTCPLNVTAARPSQDLQIEFYKWDKYIARKFISGYLIWTSSGAHCWYRDLHLRFQDKRKHSSVYVFIDWRLGVFYHHEDQTQFLITLQWEANSELCLHS